ncbi:MAG: NUDIX hydrolase [Clostridia bacterium]|nr:NUDIX hydrolase [Clostridia bacterium]
MENSRKAFSVAVDLLIFTVRDGRLCLLLSRRGKPPFEGRWALPGRLVDLDESVDRAADRLLCEMLPVQGVFVEQLYTFSDPHRDPRGRVVSVACLAIVPWQRLQQALAGGETPFECFEARLDASGLALCRENEAALSRADLAFDHGSIIEMGIRRLRGKIDYTDIAFSFLENPSSFSLRSLLTVHEAVLDREIDFSNFRRAMRTRYFDSGHIVPTEKELKPRRGRPAALYRLTDNRKGDRNNA